MSISIFIKSRQKLDLAVFSSAL
uniref:Uncharacterized protein n=1 Tax=Anguilla anguilla TaxID=7936 RepID=A0A0E9SSD4_ANGAN